jgi:hypothetical protein
MLYATPTWHGLQQFGWLDLPRIAIAGSRFHWHLLRKFQHIPNTAASFIQHSLAMPTQSNTVHLLQDIRTRIHGACLSAGVPQLTCSSLLRLNAQQVALSVFP